MSVFSFSDVAWRDEMIRELREALKFYADAKNYQQRGWQGDPDPSPSLKMCRNEWKTLLLSATPRDLRCRLNHFVHAFRALSTPGAT